MKNVIRLVSIAMVLAVCLTFFLVGNSLGMIGKASTSVNAHVTEKLPFSSFVPKLLPTSASNTFTKGMTSTSSSLAPYHGFSAYTFTDAQGNTLRYYLSAPIQYNSNRKYPLVLFLHGGGERSNPKSTALQNEQKLVGDPYIRVWSNDFTSSSNPHIQQKWPCFMLVPQIEVGQNWVNVPVNSASYALPSQPSEGLFATKELLDYLQQLIPGIDSHRLYITGLSLGGLGTWDAIERWPGYFAAAVPVAGAGDPAKANVLQNTPIWAFHGVDDTTVPTQGSQNMVEALQAVGNQPHYTKFPGRAHEIWDLVYGYSSASKASTTLYPWLFSQRTS